MWCEKFGGLPTRDRGGRGCEKEGTPRDCDHTFLKRKKKKGFSLGVRF